MSASDLIKRFQSEGALERRGEFQVDREKAREKMQKFQLPDPHAYVLELVKFATLLGATRIRFEIDADEMRMTCDSEALTAEDLENLYGAAFSRLKSKRQRALRHLAIGLTAADALSPSVVQIRSVGNDGGASFESKGGEEHIRELSAGTIHTEIYIREKFRPGHLTEFFSSLAGSLAEHYYLRERCLYSNVDITLGTEQISSGIKSNAQFQRVIDTPHEHGLIWLLDSATPDSRVEILQNGVLIATHRFAGNGAPFHAVVESTRLTTDLTQSAFVKDEAFNSLTNVMLVRIHDQLLTDKFMSLPISQWGSEHKTVGMLAVELIKVVGRARSLEVSTHKSRLKLAEKLEQYPLLPLASSALPVRRAFETTRLGQDNLAPIAAARKQGAIYFSYERMPTIELPDKPTVFLAKKERVISVGPIKVAELARYLGVKSFDVTEDLQRRSAWETNQRKWKHQQWPTTLKPDIFPVQLEFVEADLTCRMGIRTGPPLPSSVAWVKDGRLLSQESLGSGSFPWLSFLFVGSIEPNAWFDGPAGSEANRKIALRAISKVPELMDRFASLGAEWSHICIAQLLRYVEALADGELHVALRKAVSLGGPDDRIFEGLASQSSHWSFGPRETAEEFLIAVRGLKAVGEAKIFETLDGSMVSLLDLANAYLERGTIFVVHERHRNEGLQPAYETVREQTGVTIWSDNELDRLLYRLVGTNAQSARKRIIFQAAKARFLQRPKLKFDLPRDRYLSVIEVDDPAARIKVGLAPIARVEDGEWQGHVRYENRLVEHIVDGLPMAEFDVVMNTTGVYPNTSFDALEEGAPKFELWSRIEKRCQSVLYSWVRHYGSSYELPAKLGRDEEIFWAFFHELHRRVPQDWDELVVARHDNGDEVTAKLLRTEVRYGKLAFVREGLERVDELIPGPGNIPVLTVRPAVDMSRLVPDSVELIDVSKTRENIEFLEEAESRFMRKPQGLPEITAAVEVRVEIEDANMRGALALLSSSKNEFNRQIEVDLCYRSRLVETRRIMVPFGSFKAVVESTDFVLDATWSSVEKGHRDVWPVVRDAAAGAVLELCDEWDRSHHVLREKTREMILHFLSQAAHDREGVGARWREVCERLETTKIFRMADRTWIDFRALERLQQERGGPCWLNVLDLPENTWAGVDPASVVVVENGVKDVLSLLPMFTWKHARDLANTPGKQRPTPVFAGPAERLEGVPVEQTQPSMRGLGSRLSEILRSVRVDRHILLGDAVIAHIELEAFDEARIARVSPNKVVLNESHPVVKHALENPDDPVALSFLGSSVYTAINVFYREISDNHEFEFQMRYARWMRSVLNS